MVDVDGPNYDESYLQDDGENDSDSKLLFYYKYWSY